MPLFSKVYQELKKWKVPFGDESSVSIWNGVPDSQKPESERQQEGVIWFKGSLEPKYQKLKDQFDTVLSNIILANEILDDCDPNDDIWENDVVNDVIVTLKNTEPKLENLCLKLKHEELFNYLLVLNDDLKTTMFRYNRLKSGARPAKFVRTCILEGEKP